jgi:hypothetical protein
MILTVQLANASLQGGAMKDGFCVSMGPGSMEFSGFKYSTTIASRTVVNGAEEDIFQRGSRKASQIYLRTPVGGVAANMC